MLLGEFRHTLDAKGRVFVPAKWREELAQGVVVARGLDGCLYVLATSRFTELADRLAALPLEKGVNRAYARQLFGAASEERMDGQGRITIPPSLREHAGLTKDVVVVGVSDRGEIWDRARWEEYQSATNYESVAEELSL